MVTIVAYDPAWPAAYAREAARIRPAFGPGLKALEHIGSTSVPGLCAKPIIDILAGVSAIDGVEGAEAALADMGYEALGEHGLEGRRYFRKRDADGTRRVHLHVYEVESDGFVRHLLLRDYLRLHPQRAQAYAALKQDIAVRAGSDRSAYVEGKSSFVAELEAEARAWRRRLDAVHG